MSRLLRLTPVLAACACAAAPAAPASAAAKVKYPSVTKVAPLKAGVGDTLTLQGKGFRSGKGKNTVVFKRDGRRAVFVRAGAATSTRISVTVPAKMLGSLGQKSGKAVATRFRVRVLAGRLGLRYTSAKASPMIGPVALAKKSTANDCDGDLVPNARDLDDDNDLLTDTLEATLKTDACKRDSDGDGMTDGWEHESALDYNGRAKPSPTRKPYPNALNKADGAVDSDGDGLINLVEYAAWATTGGGKTPLNYSGGDPATGGKLKPAAGREFADRDKNGFLSDNERDADGDGLPNQDESGVGPLPVLFDVVGFFADEYIALKPVRDVVDVVPLYGPLAYVKKVQGTEWLDADSDGDTVRDGEDDQDGDGVPNLQELLEELAAGPGDKSQRPLNPCAPSLDARLCVVGDDDIDNDGQPNRADTDDDGDALPDVTERQFKLNPFKVDTDGDEVGDGFEYYSAKDLNGAAVPFPGKQPYPNPLTAGDEDVDHDGDGLYLLDEYEAWMYRRGLDAAYDREPLPLSYSDGQQFTGGGTTLDSDKDVDGDLASNITEAHGPLSGSAFWTSYTSNERIKCSENYVETKYFGADYQGLSFVDPDTDGDGILDGADDIDHDGLTNLEEGDYSEDADGFRNPRVANWCDVYVSVGPGPGNNEPLAASPQTDIFVPGLLTPAGEPVRADRYARVNPFNPCKPVNSAACHKFTPFNYYVDTQDYIEDWKGAQPNR